MISYNILIFLLIITILSNIFNINYIEGMSNNNCFPSWKGLYSDYSTYHNNITLTPCGWDRSCYYVKDICDNNILTVKRCKGGSHGSNNSMCNYWFVDICGNVCDDGSKNKDYVQKNGFCPINDNTYKTDPNDVLKYYSCCNAYNNANPSSLCFLHPKPSTSYGSSSSSSAGSSGSSSAGSSSSSSAGSSGSSSAGFSSSSSAGSSGSSSAGSSGSSSAGSSSSSGADSSSSSSAGSSGSSSAGSSGSSSAGSSTHYTHKINYHEPKAYNSLYDLF